MYEIRIQMQSFIALTVNFRLRMPIQVQIIAETADSKTFAWVLNNRQREQKFTLTIKNGEEAKPESKYYLEW